MSSVLPRIRKRISFGNAAFILAGSAALAQVLGFLRTKLINANFIGANVPSDQNAGVYFAAFVLPDFFFFTIAAGALGVAVMPYLSDRLQNGDRKGIWELSSSLINVLSIVLFVVGIIMLVFAEPLAGALAHGFTPEQKHNVAVMMRILAFNPLIFSVSGVISAAQQVYGRFFFYAIAPLFYNLAIIVALFVFRDNIGIIGLAIGAVVGAVLQLLVVLTGTYGLGFSWKPRVVRDRDFKNMIRQLPARSFDQGLDQVQNIVDTNIASGKLVGGATAVSNYNNAYVLHTAPILLVGSTIATAFFPRLSARLSQGRPDLFRKDFLRVFTLLLWLIVPVAIVSFFARGYLVRLIFSRNSTEISIIFGSLVLAVIFRSLYAIVSRWFYAQKDTRTPLIISIIVITLNVYLSYTLSRPHYYGVQGLAIAQSIVSGIELLILLSIIIKRDRKIFDMSFLSSIIKIISVSGFALVAGKLAVTQFPLTSYDTGPLVLGSKLTFITLMVFLTYLGVSWVFGMKEASSLIRVIKRFIFRRVKVEN